MIRALNTVTGTETVVEPATTGFNFPPASRITLASRLAVCSNNSLWKTPTCGIPNVLPGCSADYHAEHGFGPAPVNARFAGGDRTRALKAGAAKTGRCGEVLHRSIRIEDAKISAAPHFVDAAFVIAED